MQNSDVLQWSSSVIDKGSIDFLERVKSFNDLSEDGCFAIEEIEILAKCDDELTAGKSLIRVGWRLCRCQTHCASFCMLLLSRDFRFECHPVWNRWLLASAIGQGPDRGSSIAIFRFGAYRVASLEGEIGLHVVYGRVVVVLYFAKL